MQILLTDPHPPVVCRKKIFLECRPTLYLRFLTSSSFFYGGGENKKNLPTDRPCWAAQDWVTANKEYFTDGRIYIYLILFPRYGHIPKQICLLTSEGNNSLTSKIKLNVRRKKMSENYTW